MVVGGIVEREKRMGRKRRGGKKERSRGKEFWECKFDLDDLRVKGEILFY